MRQIKDETSVSPGNLALGASGSPGDAYLTGYYLGQELAALGINMDFAPTADVYSNPEASVIGPRSFGSILPRRASLFGGIRAGHEGSRRPAHGESIFLAMDRPDEDSHGHLPKIDVSLDRPFSTGTSSPTASSPDARRHPRGDDGAPRFSSR